MNNFMIIGIFQTKNKQEFFKICVSKILAYSFGAG
ncbi:hypothetical protein EHR_07205 [Enterococcus hirae ATCC 9790]|uniref:Uncharacterized protein n=1 Tax=Enterococcus hirae (strain ATCC 9790 / DSM 20160 / JCM 8729 / LMG 6399 / NBRC 3181 / NCIMB 6459 / NCDO 1258 / NCTC 12367 / WDCM 00089 / R) TaxID=768486 RepID=I6SY53_ENTHA|nr:hypothetical protein EHR_07205 [Enterococcus hirae ATCC 9790]